MVYVFDSSFVGALIIPDEKSSLVDRMYEKIGNEDVKYAPHLLWYEITNVLRKLVQRRRYTGEEVAQFYPKLSAIRLTIDDESGINYSKKLLRLSNDYNLSSYDAVYLELAERKNAVLCTFDEALRAAAKRYGVAVIR